MLFRSTFAKKDGVYVVNKFASKLTTSNIYYNDILISLYRASDIHLFMIEALNNMRRFEEASVFLNGGINSYYNTITGTWIEGSAFDGVGYPTALFNSRGDRSNAGIRGRVDLSPIVELDPLALNSEDDITKYIAKVDSALVAEACLESAGEIGRAHV